MIVLTFLNQKRDNLDPGAASPDGGRPPALHRDGALLLQLRHRRPYDQLHEEGLSSRGFDWLGVT